MPQKSYDEKKNSLMKKSFLEIRMFVCTADPWQFIISDADREKKHGFKLIDTLRRAGGRLFEGLSIHATPGVKPPPDQMSGELAFIVFVETFICNF